MIRQKDVMHNSMSVLYAIHITQLILKEHVNWIVKQIIIAIKQQVLVDVRLNLPHVLNVNPYSHLI